MHRMKPSSPGVNVLFIGANAKHFKPKKKTKKKRTKISLQEIQLVLGIFVIVHINPDDLAGIFALRRHEIEIGRIDAIRSIRCRMSICMVIMVMMMWLAAVARTPILRIIAAIVRWFLLLSHLAWQRICPISIGGSGLGFTIRMVTTGHGFAAIMRTIIMVTAAAIVVTRLS